MGSVGQYDIDCPEISEILLNPEIKPWPLEIVGKISKVLSQIQTLQPKSHLTLAFERVSWVWWKLLYQKSYFKVTLKISTLQHSVIVEPVFGQISLSIREDQDVLYVAAQESGSGVGCQRSDWALPGHCLYLGTTGQILVMWSGAMGAVLQAITPLT